MIFEIMVVVLLGMIQTACPDPDRFQKARTAVVFVELARQTVNQAFRVLKATQHSKCLLKDKMQGDVYTACMKKVMDAGAFYAKLDPQIIQSQKVLARAIVQAELGNAVDLVALIQESVCLVTKCAVWLPASWQKRIETILILVGKYACGAKVADLSSVEQLYVAKQLNQLLLDLTQG